MTFIKNKEDFICEHCGYEVKGNGYTNHCSKCLWSKHVDIDPGDRASDCGGMMEPIGYENLVGEERIVLRCKKCAHERPNKVSPEDSRDAIVGLASPRS
ncbi:MAG: RNHCP domain-containing protein [Candidatus Paceibacterota bacterium]